MRRVRVLFIGESRPASGRHFHARDSGLYRAVRGAFVAAFPALGRDDDFLAAFAGLGCALVDLARVPVDRLARAARRSACRAGEPRLARDLEALAPRAIVTVVRSIEPNVRRAVSRAGWRGEWLALPYPGRWIRMRSEFTAALVPALRRWRRSGVLAGSRGARRRELRGRRS